MTVLKFAIDWFECTDKKNSGAETEMTEYLVRGKTNEYQMCRSRNGYTHAIENRQGAVVMWNVKRGNMGAHITYTGKVLNIYRSEGVDAEGIVKHHSDSGHTASRIDLAIDVMDSGMSVKR